MKIVPWIGAASAILGLVVQASSIHYHHHHQFLHRKRDDANLSTADDVVNATCVCSTYVATITGEAGCKLDFILRRCGGRTIILLRQC